MELTRDIISKEVEKRRKWLISFGQEIIKKESVTFSKNIPDIMEWIVAKGKEDGFESEVINDPNYPISAWSHWGNKDNWIGVMCHLDTVPFVESEWTFPPLSGEVKNGKIYGRGTQDMKLATLSVYTAMVIFKDLGLDLKRGIKIIYGSQEETGPWSDVEHALDVLGEPEMLFTAEGGWPATQAESGIVRFDVSGHISDHSGWSIKAGNMYNAICSDAKLFIDGVKHNFKGEAIHTLKSEFEETNSAIPKAMQWLKDNGKADSFVNYILTYWNNNRFGEGTELAYESKFLGKSLINNGLLSVSKDGNFKMGFDVRYPVDDGVLNKKWHLERFESFTKKQGFKNVSVKCVLELPGYYHKDSDPVLKTIANIYWDFTGTDINSRPFEKLKAGTYAKVRKNAIAWGMVMRHEDEIRAHMADEYAIIDHWIEATKIYVEILYNLSYII